MKGNSRFWIAVSIVVLLLVGAIPNRPAVAAAPEEVNEADPWKDVRGCDITAVMVKVGEGKIDPNSEYTHPNEIHKSAGAYEYWALAILDDTGDGLRRVPTTDRWGNPLLGKIWVDNLNQVAEGEVIVYNRNGVFARGYNTPGGRVDVDQPILCIEPTIEKIDWTPAEDLKILGHHRIQFGYDGYSFESSFLLGKELTEEELRFLVAETSHGNGSYWVGTGSIGGGTSSGGFGIYNDGRLMWSWFMDTAAFHFDTYLPIETEIVVRTEILTYGGVKLPEPLVEYQRFVLWMDGTGMRRMLEPVWQ